MKFLNIILSIFLVAHFNTFLYAGKNDALGKGVDTTAATVHNSQLLDMIQNLTEKVGKLSDRLPEKSLFGKIYDWKVMIVLGTFSIASYYFFNQFESKKDLKKKEETLKNKMDSEFDAVKSRDDEWHKKNQEELKTVQTAASDLSSGVDQLGQQIAADHRSAQKKLDDLSMQDREYAVTVQTELSEMDAKAQAASEKTQEQLTNVKSEVDNSGKEIQQVVKNLFETFQRENAEFHETQSERANEVEHGINALQECLNKGMEVTGDQLQKLMEGKKLIMEKLVAQQQEASKFTKAQKSDNQAQLQFMNKKLQELELLSKQMESLDTIISNAEMSSQKTLDNIEEASRLVALLTLQQQQNPQGADRNALESEEKQEEVVDESWTPGPSFNTAPRGRNMMNLKVPDNLFRKVRGNEEQSSLVIRSIEFPKKAVTNKLLLN